MLLDAPQVMPLYAAQHKAIFDPARIVCIEATTKSGKTVGCLIWLLMLAWNGQAQAHYLWVAPIFPQAKALGYERLRDMLRRSDPMKRSWLSNDSELWIQFWNGARIWFKGSDNPDSLYGQDYHAAVVDEASRCREEAWHAVRSTLTATRGPVRIIGNVKGRRNWAYQLARKAQAGEHDMGYHKLTAMDAVSGGVMPESEIEDAKRVLPEAVYRELYMAEPSDDQGNPFGLSAIRACIYKQHDGLSPLDPVCFGIDLAKSHDWTWVVGLDIDGRVTNSERWQSDWGQTRARILAMVNGWPTLVDSTGVGDPILEDLARVRPNIKGFKFSRPSKQQLMEGLAAAIHQQLIWFPDGPLVNELEAFEYEYVQGGVRYTAPEGLHDDGVCALALAWKAYKDRDNVPIFFRSLGNTDDLENED